MKMRRNRDDAGVDLFRMFHSRNPLSSRVPSSELDLPKHPLALASVQAMHVMRRGKKQIWKFSKSQALPRLAYINPSASEKELRPTKFWLVGGAYRVDADGLHARSGDGGVVRIPVDEARALPEMAAAVRNHRQGHGDIDPRVAVRVNVPDVSSPLVDVGPLAAIIYGDDKGDGVGFGPFIHDIIVPCRPDIYVSADGMQIHIIGGRMAVFEGWLHDVPV